MAPNWIRRLRDRLRRRPGAAARPAPEPEPGVQGAQGAQGAPDDEGRPEEMSAEAAARHAALGAWFHAHGDRVDRAYEARAAVPPPQVGGRFLCPCCGLPTLDERGIYDICELCWWEDDGQDDPHASEVWGGPNQGSLTEARRDYRGFVLHLMAPPEEAEASPCRAALGAHVWSVLHDPATFDRALYLKLLRRAESEAEAKAKAEAASPPG